jgi:uncharacterized protein (DUF1778 family)
MSSITIRLPDSVHRKIKEVAKEDGISINQFISSAAGEKLASVLTASYLEKRASKGSKQKYQRVLAKVSKRAPLEYDQVK